MPRAYHQTQRAAQTEDRRRQILHAVGSLMVRGAFDDMTLQAVADEAGVSLKTVTRHFGTKDALLRAAMEEATAHEEAARRVPTGDLDAIVAVLAARYEDGAEMIYRIGDMELKHAWLSEWIQRARQSHLDWLGQAFAAWLPPAGPTRTQRLMCLFVATEVRSWWALRHRLAQDPAQAAAVLKAGLAALVGTWEQDAPPEESPGG
jgi:AcrR family transcriptional regulator